MHLLRYLMVDKDMYLLLLIFEMLHIKFVDDYYLVVEYLFQLLVHDMLNDVKMNEIIVDIHL